MSKKNRHKYIEEAKDEAVTDAKVKRDGSPLEARTQAQAQYMMLLESTPLVFALGPAGTGKTMIPSYMAADLLDDGMIQQVVLIRPLVSTGKDIGALPGEEFDKIRPHFEPLLEHFYRRLGERHVPNLIKNRRILLQPFEFIRGATFNNAWIIIDEAENATPAQMKAALTRLGKYSKVVINGDPYQCDLDIPENGLMDAIRKMQNVHQAGFVEFGSEDIVRSGLTKQVVEAYDGEYRRVLTDD